MRTGAKVENKYGTRYVAEPADKQASAMRKQRWWELSKKDKGQ